MLSRRRFLKTQAAGAALPFALAGVVTNGETSEESLTSPSSGPHIHPGPPKLLIATNITMAISPIWSGWLPSWMVSMEWLLYSLRLGTFKEQEI